LRIAFVVTRANPIGGVQIHVRDLAVRMREQGHQPTVITGGGGPLVDLLREAGVPVLVLRHLTVPIRPVSDLLALREIRAALLQVRPEIIAVHSSKAGILGRIVARSLGIPAVLTAHGWNFTPGIAPIPAAAYRQIERLAGSLATRIITVSDYDRQLAIEAGITKPDRIVAVYNGIPDVDLASRADPERTPPRLIMVARFSAQKDHGTLLRALGGLQELAWDLDLVGDGPLMEQAESLARSLGIGSRVRFLGQRLDVERLLAEAQVSVLTSNWEGFPLTILEAMRAGLPVVATAVAGVSESIRAGETGYLVPRGDVGIVRDRVKRLLLDPALRRRMGENGRASFERCFTVDTFVEKTVAVFEAILAERDSRRMSPVATGRVRSSVPAQQTE
jgi:glycosyltransferase involved in cell wall biosynthesis